MRQLFHDAIAFAFLSSIMSKVTLESLRDHRRSVVNCWPNHTCALHSPCQPQICKSVKTLQTLWHPLHPAVSFSCSRHVTTCVHFVHNARPKCTSQGGLGIRFRTLVVHSGPRCLWNRVGILVIQLSISFCSHKQSHTSTSFRMRHHMQKREGLGFAFAILSCISSKVTLESFSLRCHASSLV